MPGIRTKMAVPEGQANYVYQIPAQAYEGASNTYKDEQRALLAGEADTLAAREVLNLRMRVAHAYRNNGYVTSAADKTVINQGEVLVTWVNKKGKKHTQMQDLWDEFYKNPNLDGYGDFGTTQSTWWYEYVLTGESHTRMVIQRQGNSNRIPLKLQTIPTCLHALGYANPTVDNEPGVTYRYGMKFRNGKPESYFYRKGALETPFAYTADYNVANLTEVPANEILKVFKRTSAGQWIGIPSLAPVLVPLYEIDELVDATVAKQKVAQAVNWFIENTSPLSMTPTGTPINVIDKDNQSKIVFKTTGGNTLYLNKGEKISQLQSGDIGPNLITLMQQGLYRIAASQGIPYHALTGDLSGLNYSSIRAVALEWRTYIEFLHHTYMKPLALVPLTDYFFALAKLYFPAVGNAKAVFQLPKFNSVDPLKDTQEAVLAIQNGLGTLTSYLNKNHLESDEIAEDRKLIEQLGLTSLLQPNGANIAQANNTEANSNSSSL